MTRIIATVAVSAAFLVCTGYTADGGEEVHSAPLGLVLSGGGAKGAYEIGVWQILQKLGIASNITAISGTSVGALNAALFAACPDDAEKLWLENVTGVFKVKADRLTVDSSKMVADIMAARTTDRESGLNGQKVWAALAAKAGKETYYEPKENRRDSIHLCSDNVVAESIVGFASSRCREAHSRLPF